MRFKRIIPCLDFKDGRIVKGVHFVNLRDAGDPVENARLYDAEGADELVFLDISATIEGRATMVEAVHRVARAVSIRFTIGGGVRIIEDVQRLLKAGASKVSINTAAVRPPPCSWKLPRVSAASASLSLWTPDRSPQTRLAGRSKCLSEKRNRRIPMRRYKRHRDAACTVFRIGSK